MASSPPHHPRPPTLPPASHLFLVLLLAPRASVQSILWILDWADLGWPEWMDSGRRGFGPASHASDCQSAFREREHIDLGETLAFCVSCLCYPRRAGCSCEKSHCLPGSRRLCSTKQLIALWQVTQRLCDSKHSSRSFLPLEAWPVNAICFCSVILL